MHIKRKKIFLIVLGVVFACVFAFFFVTRHYFIGLILDHVNQPGRNAKYLSDDGYANTLGVADLDDEDILEKYGEPENQECWVSESNPDVNILDCVYPSFNALYVVSKTTNGENKYYLTLLRITDENLRFGKLHIGIGSTRLAVRLAYLFDKKISKKELAYSAKDYPGVDEGFYGERAVCILVRSVQKNQVYEKKRSGRPLRFAVLQGFCKKKCKQNECSV
jgi:hypothetical protein